MIFCDMDGVLADFDKALKKEFGVSSSGSFESRKKMWEKIQAVPDYWINLPKTKDADKLIEYLSNFDFKILTGIPSLGRKKASVEKKKWVKNNFSHKIEVITCLRKSKRNVCSAGDVLIDDFHENIGDWESVGGIGILHKNAHNTIKKLKKIGY